MVSQDAGSYDLNELCRRGGVTARTVRFYIQQGLLPPPSQMGPGARYGDEHLNRLRLIRRLQRRHLPLAEIRRQFENMDESEVATLAVGNGDSASDYLDRVLRHDAGDAVRDFPRMHAMRVPHSKELEHPPAFPRERAQWERYTLVDDVELHVRRPLSRDMNRRVDRLLEAARKILSDDEDEISGGGK